MSTIPTTTLVTAAPKEDFGLLGHGEPNPGPYLRPSSSAQVKRGEQIKDSNIQRPKFQLCEDRKNRQLQHVWISRSDYPSASSCQSSNNQRVKGQRQTQKSWRGQSIKNEPERDKETDDAQRMYGRIAEEVPSGVRKRSRSRQLNIRAAASARVTAVRQWHWRTTRQPDEGRTEESIDWIKTLPRPFFQSLLPPQQSVFGACKTTRSVKKVMADFRKV
ncbi:hypothetical protein C8R47DRAFT_1078536 [Mycena vitilis]|nr:hypothetical protein C8R47DRAFT_1078536 [Mycena vitilis]